MKISWDAHNELKILKKTLKPRYKLLRYVSEGGFGKIFKLYDKVNRKECPKSTVKFLKAAKTRKGTRKILFDF